MHSPAAENLVLGTACAESRLIYLKQVGGPALGLWQVEGATHRDLWRNYLRHRPALADKLSSLAARRSISLPHTAVHDFELIGNLAYAAAVCRFIYFRRPEALPDADDLEALAMYWKQHYNTPAGAGTIQHFIENYPD